MEDHLPSPQLTSIKLINPNIIQSIQALPQISNQELSLIRWRHSTHHPIFKVLSFQSQSNSTMLRVFYESDDYLLRDLPHITFEDALHIFKTVLLSMGKLISLFSFFNITDENIGFRNNQCKIWVNSNFSSNQVQKQLSLESQMVQSLISTILSHLEKEKVPQQFFSTALKECKTIITCIQFYNQYIYEHQIHIPPSIRAMKRKSCLKNYKNLSTQKKIKKSIKQLSTDNETEKFCKKKSVNFQPSQKLSLEQPISLNLRPNRRRETVLNSEQAVQMRNIKKMKEMIQQKLKKPENRLMIKVDQVRISELGKASKSVHEIQDQIIQ